ncbi:MAG: hypothetical protein Q7S42_05065 [Candidatus Omnitrophota bacterium]|nr:hypothetical protein [Candidatus Omnitrophota bacterium]
MAGDLFKISQAKTLVLLMALLAVVGCGGKIEKGKKAALLMDKYHGPTVTISGRVYSLDGKSEIIVVSASRSNLGPPDIALTQVSSGETYLLKVPKYFGDAYIRARVLKAGERFREDTLGCCASYDKNPLKIGSSDIKDLDLAIKASPFILMDFYPGPTVTVSGAVIFLAYRGGKIVISASSKSRSSADVAIMIIPGPQEYSLKLPKNFGDIYLSASNLDPGVNTPSNKSMGKYAENPLKVGSRDIKSINIEF